MVNDVALKMPESNSGIGWLALGFVNTVSWHASTHPEEKLTSYDKLVDWARNSKVLTPADARNLIAQARKKPEEAKAVLEKAIELREAIYHMLADWAHKLPVRASDLQVLNRAIVDILPRSQLMVIKAGEFSWGWRDVQASLDAMLWPVVRSAADLFTSDLLRRVGQCADERGCGWLFIDTSKNRSRRWCNMGDCGNRAKARRHYQKQATARKAD